MFIFSCSKKTEVGNEIKKAWKLSETINGSINVEKGDTLLFNEKTFVLKSKGRVNIGKYSINPKDSTLQLIFDLDTYVTGVDSIAYQVLDNQPVIRYFRKKKEVTRITESGLVSERVIKKFKVLVCDPNHFSFSDDKKTFSANYEIAIKETNMSFYSLFRGMIGIFFLVLVLFLLSNNKKAISWKLVTGGIIFQILFALLILKVPFVATLFEVISGFFVEVLAYTKEGAKFVFGGLLNTESTGFIFAFQILPTILFFSALTSIFYYLGLLQKIVYGLSWLLGKVMTMSGAENLSTTANIFLGQTEAPLMIKPFLANMNRSELLCIMVGGMANTAGGVLAAYIGFLGGDDPAQQLFYAKHLLAASIMSAPATIVVSKMLIPQTEKIDEKLELNDEKIGGNLLEAISIGTGDGLRLAVNVAAMLIVFIALTYMANSILSSFGSFTSLNNWLANVSGGQYKELSLQAFFAYPCSIVAYAIGVCKEDILFVGQLLGEKTVINEFNAYISLGAMKAQNAFSEPKSIIMATYILSGFANFASIGIQIGGIGALAPNKRGMLSELGIKAMIGGTIASLFTATIVGMLI